MPKIRRLSLHEAQKIAAGEVVDRPANVVKELIENSIDAGATHISLFVEQAGKKLIRVVDNGSGMDEEDAHLCFEQHATSKICSVEDLQSIATFGFRGEALASIAAVSTVTLITKQAHDELGIKLMLTHGVLIDQEPVACTTGTDISIYHLFENIPVRKKFLKTDETEWRTILHLVHAVCLDNIQVHIRLFHDGKQILNCPGTDTLMLRITQLWDSSRANAQLPFQATSSDHRITIYGAASHHQYYRYDRSSLYLFVNKRWVKNYQLSNAFLNGYQSVLPSGRYPAGCLFITIDQELIDINIHPRKEEVLFLHPVKITTFISATIKKTLEDHVSNYLKKPISFSSQNSTIQKTSLVSAPTAFSRTHDSFDTNRLINNLTNITSYTPKPFEMHKIVQAKSSPLDCLKSVSLSSESAEESAENQQVQVSQEVGEIGHHELFTIVGQYHKTYILVDHPDGLFMVDQHAAHERILYELFKGRFHDVVTVSLLFPLIITLTEHEVATIEQHQTLFQEHGIIVQRFSRNQLSVESIPVHLKENSLDDIFRQAVGWLDELQHLNSDQIFKSMHEKLHTQMACKAAVKAGDELAHEKMLQLLRDLDKTKNKLTCPHGRPTGWLLSLHEIEKKFKRKI